MQPRTEDINAHNVIGGESIRLPGTILLSSNFSFLINFIILINIKIATRDMNPEPHIVNAGTGLLDHSGSIMYSKLTILVYIPIYLLILISPKRF